MKSNKQLKKYLKLKLPKSFKGSFGFRNDTKKAIVTLKEGNTIDASVEIK